MNAQELMAKAHRAVASARNLLQDNDGDGASISSEEAQWAVQQAQAFVDEVEKRFMAAVS